jgi:hypothetical protein
MQCAVCIRKTYTTLKHKQLPTYTTTRYKCTSTLHPMLSVAVSTNRKPRSTSVLRPFHILTHSLTHSVLNVFFPENDRYSHPLSRHIRPVFRVMIECGHTQISTRHIGNTLECVDLNFGCVHTRTQKNFYSMFLDLVEQDLVVLFYTMYT